MTIRQATLDDLSALVAFNQSIAKETEDVALDSAILTPGIRRFLEQDRYGFYTVAETDGHVVGSLMITYEWSDWRNGVIWWVQSVYVSKKYRRQGIYRGLYQNVQKLAKADGNVCGFRLYVEKDNTVAQDTYRSLGMTETYYRLFEDMENSAH